MTDSKKTDPAAVQRRIDRYLKEVDDTLKEHGSSWRDRNSIRENIQTQIREMLEERAGVAPSAQDADAVIAKLDDPKSYLAELSQQVPPSTRNPLKPVFLVLYYLALLVAISCVMGFIVPLIAVFLGSRSEWKSTFGPNPVMQAVWNLCIAVIFFVIARIFRKGAAK